MQVCAYVYTYISIYLHTHTHLYLYIYITHSEVRGAVASWTNTPAARQSSSPTQVLLLLLPLKAHSLAYVLKERHLIRRVAATQARIAEIFAAIHC